MAMQHTRGVLHASIEQVEENLFRAEYLGELNPENPDRRALPDTHVATTDEAVKTWVEQMALSMGYERVDWDRPPGAAVPGGRGAG